MSRKEHISFIVIFFMLFEFQKTSVSRNSWCWPQSKTFCRMQMIVYLTIMTQWCRQWQFLLLLLSVTSFSPAAEGHVWSRDNKEKSKFSLFRHFRFRWKPLAVPSYLMSILRRGHLSCSKHYFSHSKNGLAFFRCIL